MWYIKSERPTSRAIGVEEVDRLQQLEARLLQASELRCQRNNRYLSRYITDLHEHEAIESTK
jgi:hypothetical protein